MADNARNILETFENQLSFRNEGIFYENVSNRILDDLVATLQPRRMKLVAAFTPRGGITTSVTVEHQVSSSKFQVSGSQGT
ncbi:MAG: hypothetical protein JF612_05545 [Planctomycetia bacterium]|nr:hypothetical protein [Planctomycetia bacterium]